MASLDVNPEYLETLATRQELAAMSVEGSISAVSSDVITEITRSHGTISIPTNHALKGLAETRQEANCALAEATRLMAEYLRAAANSYAAVDADQGAVLASQMQYR